MGGRKMNRIRQGPVTMRGWKPYTTRPPVLIAFMAVSLCLAGVIEIFAQRSQRNGGLALSTSADKIPRSVTIAYLYLPTTISVIYSIAWTWIDLDIRRIQPWLELSRRDGATAEASILVDYPFEFLAFVPFKAWKRKHWPVFFAGSIMMIIFWAITPLQTAVFGLQAVVLNRASSIIQNNLLALDQQGPAISESILNDAYGITWLGQDFPGYTTSEYAIIPFSPEGSTTLFPNETWTGTSTKLSTDLSCWPASVNESESFGTFNFDNGRGCTAQVSMSYANTLNNSYIHGVQYIGYHQSSLLDWYLQGPSCSRNSTHQFLAVYFGFDNTVRQFDKLTGLFCEPLYRKQDVSVTITAENKQPDDASIITLDNETTLTESEFNSTAFEYLIGTGVSPVIKPRDYPDDIVLHQFSQFFDKPISWPLTPMVGFALGNLTVELGELSNPNELRAVFAAAHKMLFSVAISRLISSNPRNEVGSGNIQYALYGVVISRPIAAVVEGLLVAVAILIGLTLFSCQRSESSLLEDPASMRSMFNILRGSDYVLDRFLMKDSLNNATLARTLTGQRYGLVSQALGMEKVNISLEVLDINEDRPHERYTVSKISPFRPKELRPWTGLVLVAILTSVVILLAVLKQKESVLGGLPRPSQNFEVLQILENYIPTVFATLLEPFLILLNRLLCILQPFHDLRRGKIERSKALETTYASIPPQFVILRAIRSRHFLLAAACAVSLLANILAVALGGLFNELPVSVSSSITLQQTQMAAFSRSRIVDSDISDTYSGHFYVVMANLSDGTKLPPWTSSRFAFLPYEPVGPSADNTSSIFQGRTRGFGVEASCQQLFTAPDAPSFVDYSFFGNGTQSISVVYKQNDETQQTCIPALTGSRYLEYNRPVGTSSYELFTSLRPPREAQGTANVRPDDGGFCERKLLVSWMRVDPASRSEDVEATHIECSPVFRTGMFNVAVDASGYVLEATLVGEYDNVPDISSTEIESMLTEANGVVSDVSGLMPTSTLTGLNSLGWHNDTLTRDWMNYLLKMYTKSTAFVDPAQGVPDSSVVMPMVADIYQRLFAALMGLELSFFKTQSEPSETTGTVITPDTRIFMDEIAFIISIAILSLNIIVALILYTRERHFYLPRMPSTIASVIAYVAASRAIREHGVSEEDTAHGGVGRVKTTYSFGRYIGVDGKSHVGIEIDPLVVPIDTHLKNANPPYLPGWLRKRKGATFKPEEWL